MDFVQISRFFSSVFFTEVISEKIVFLNCGKKRMILTGKKNEILKRAKKWTFSKRVSLWILSKNRTFSCRRFSQKSYQKRSFLILWKEKMILSGKN